MLKLIQVFYKIQVYVSTAPDRVTRFYIDSYHRAVTLQVKYSLLNIK